ncbi:MAG: sigma-70 family RNA polymerase sigma factor [Myxococcaceae bacterium]
MTEELKRRPAIQDESSSSASLDEVIQCAIATARTAHPFLNVDPSHFTHHLARHFRQESGRSVQQVLESLHHADIFLSLAALSGDAVALAELEQRTVAQCARVARRMRLSSTDADELVQAVRMRLLVSGESELPKLQEYSGRGPLALWIRSMAVRLALNAQRGKHEIPLSAEVWQRWPADGLDAELSLLRARFKADFKEAFDGAFGVLTVPERNLLRLHLLDDLTIDSLAVLEGAHRATVARRIVRGKAILEKETKRRLCQKLRISLDEIEELMLLARSQLDVSVRRLLQAASAPETKA